MAKLTRRTVWLCTDADSLVGLWYASRDDAFAKAGTWQTVFPVTFDLPSGAAAPLTSDQEAQVEREAIQTETRS